MASLLSFFLGEKKSTASGSEIAFDDTPLNFTARLS